MQKYLWVNYKVISDDGTALYVETLGKGEPILLCDGIMCSGHIWKYMLSHFKDKQFIHWHYPGHGLSETPHHSVNLSSIKLASDIKKILDYLRIDKTIVAGHSFGVHVALEMALKYPDNVHSLILICGAPGRFISTFNDSDVLKNILPFLDILLRFMPRKTLSLWRSIPINYLLSLAKYSDLVNSRLVSIDDLKPYFKGFLESDPGTALKMLEASDRYDLFPMLGQITTKTLILAGANDRFTPAKISQKMYHKLNNAELLLASAGTHSLPLEQPDLVNLRIEEFLNR